MESHWHNCVLNFADVLHIFNSILRHKNSLQDQQNGKNANLWISIKQNVIENKAYMTKKCIFQWNAFIVLLSLDILAIARSWSDALEDMDSVVTRGDGLMLVIVRAKYEKKKLSQHYLYHNALGRQTNRPTCKVNPLHPTKFIVIGTANFFKIFIFKHFSSQIDIYFYYLISSVQLTRKTTSSVWRYDMWLRTTIVGSWVQLIYFWLHEIMVRS